jgi:hypothetical protein
MTSRRIPVEAIALNGAGSRSIPMSELKLSPSAVSKPGQGWRSVELVLSGRFDKPQNTKSTNRDSSGFRRSGLRLLGHIASAVLDNFAGRKGWRP